MATNRGVSVSASFAHFDPQGVGYADSRCLMDGLSRLGIGISPAAADILMSMIGRASSLHFRASDLVMFADLDSDDENEDLASTDDYNKNASNLDSESLRSGSTRQSASSRRRKRPPAKQQQQQNYVKVDDTEDMRDAQPLDLDYKVGHANTNSDAKEDSALPRWARKSTKKAFKELQAAEDRHKSKRRQSFHYDDDISDSDNSGGDNDNDGKKLNPDPKPKPIQPIIFPDEDTTKVEPAAAAAVALEDKEAEEEEAESISIQSSESASLSSLVPSLALTNDSENEDDVDPNDLDNLFHCHSSIVMSYRILNAGNRPSANKNPNSTVLQVTETLIRYAISLLYYTKLTNYSTQLVMQNLTAYKEAQNILERLEPMKDTPFQLIVTPDIFMTLDTLSECLELLLDQNPMSSILLVGLPGLPNTLWQKSTILNNETHADCLSHLLQHLEQNKQVSERTSGNGYNHPHPILS